MKQTIEQTNNKIKNLHYALGASVKIIITDDNKYKLEIGKPYSNKIIFIDITQEQAFKIFEEWFNNSEY